MANWKTNYVEYCALKNAIYRCHNTKCNQYSDYGGRGIAVADCWKGPNGLDNFLAHIGPKPSPELTLERIDNNKGYEPGNVCWASRTEQQRNRRKAKRVEHNLIFNGEKRTLKEWAVLKGVSYPALLYRFKTGVTGDDLFLQDRLPRRNPTVK